MNGPLILIAVPTAAAILTLILRPLRQIGVFIAVAALLVTAVWMLQAPLDEPQVILGRTIALAGGDRLGIALLYVITAAILVSARLASPSWPYDPFALFVLSALSAALIYRPPLNEVYPTFVYSALFIAIASALCAVTLHSERPGGTSGALRFLVFSTLALPVLLLADWTLGQLSQSPDTPELIQRTIGLIALGFALLLAVFPFHSWAPGIAGEAPPPSTAIVLTVLFGAVWILLLDALYGNRLIATDPNVPELLKAAGLIMTASGGLLAWAQHDFGRLLGYAALVDTGAILFAVGIRSDAGLAAAFMLVTGRVAGIGLMSVGLATARARATDSSFAALRGLLWKLPWAALAIIAGGLSLSGMPPLAGFPGRWGLAQQAAAIDPRAAAILLGAGASVAVGALRGLREMLQPFDENETPISRERLREIILIAVAVTLCLAFGLFPGLLAPIARTFVVAFQ